MSHSVRTYDCHLSLLSTRRRAVPAQLPVDGEDDPEAPVPRVRTHLPPALPAGDPAGGGGSPQHLLQTLHLLRARVRPRRQTRTRPPAGAHRQTDEQGSVRRRGGDNRV